MEGQHPARRRRDIPWMLVIFALLALYAVLLLVLNADQVEVSFVFFTAEISLLVLILLCLVIGFAAGYLFERFRDRRKHAELSSS